MHHCCICNNTFNDNDLLQNSKDEYFCKECFRIEFCASKQVSQKKKPLVNKYEGDAGITTRKMFTSFDLELIKKRRSSKNNLFTSKRPLQCPHYECNKYVSVYDLNAHFQHEHMDVKKIQTNFDTRHPLNFYLTQINYEQMQCLLLLTILPVIEETSNTPSLQEKFHMPVTIVVLASRVSPSQLGVKEYNSSVDEYQKDGKFDNKDKIILWAASNVVCKYSYTIAASTISEDVRVKYYGPILQLGKSPAKLCLEGQGLVLSHFHAIGMSDFGSKPLHLDVIIHSED